MSNESEVTLTRHFQEADIQTIVSEISRAEPVERARLLSLLPKDKTRSAFAYFEPDIQRQIISEMKENRALSWLEEMEPDDRARLFDELPDEQSQQFMRKLSPAERKATALLLEYPPETAGRIMSPYFLPLKENMTVEEALSAIRRKGDGVETVYELPIINDDLILQGVVTLRNLILAGPDDRIKDIAREERKAFSVNDDQEEVARFVQNTDWLAVPIVEEDGRLVGIVTIDDAMDILRIEETEDISRAGATEPLGKPYFSLSVFQLMRKRVIWLCFLAIAGTLTVNVLSAFESTLEQVVSLALFVPLLIGIGGNVGAQSATTIVRALAVDDVRPYEILRVALREASVGAMLGVSLAAIGLIIVWTFFDSDIAFIVALTLVAICTLAALAGALMPIFARTVRLDPAVVSAPFVTTVVDASGLIIYFMIARIIIGLDYSSIVS